MRPPIAQLLPVLAFAIPGCIGRADRPAAAPVVRDSQRVNTAGVPQPENAEHELSPEQVLRTFLIAMIEADEAGIRSVAMPRPNMEILWRQTAKVEPGVREQMLRDVRQA